MGWLIAELVVAGVFSLQLVVVLLGTLSQIVEVGDQAVHGLLVQGLVLAVFHYFALVGEKTVECCDDTRKQSPWRHFGESVLGVGVEGVEHVNFCEMVDEDVLGEEGRPLFSFHLE